MYPETLSFDKFLQSMRAEICPKSKFRKSKTTKKVAFKFPESQKLISHIISEAEISKNFHTMQDCKYSVSSLDTIIFKPRFPLQKLIFILFSHKIYKLGGVHL